ncbi:MAG: hypothetical protein AAGL49_04310 [Pseudomonadota bacterium]
MILIHRGYCARLAGDYRVAESSFTVALEIAPNIQDQAQRDRLLTLSLLGVIMLGDHIDIDRRIATERQLAEPYEERGDLESATKHWAYLGVLIRLRVARLIAD